MGLTDKYLSYLEMGMVMTSPDKDFPQPPGWGYSDVPNIDDYDDYITHKDFMLPEADILEQDEEEEAPPEEPVETPADEEPAEEPADEMPPEEGMGGEEGMGEEGMGGEDEMGGEMGGGMPGEETKTVEEIGRIYELKKIYSRLVAVESYLSDSSDITLLKLRNFVSNSIELFETLISNIDTFKGELDETIVLYYEFLDRTYWIMRKFYEQKEIEEEQKDKKRKK